MPLSCGRASPFVSGSFSRLFRTSFAQPGSEIFGRLNADLMGETTDLRDFLFGAERSALGACAPGLVGFAGWQMLLLCGFHPGERGGGRPLRSMVKVTRQISPTTSFWLIVVAIAKSGIVSRTLPIWQGGLSAIAVRGGSWSAL